MPEPRGAFFERSERAKQAKEMCSNFCRWTGKFLWWELSPSIRKRIAASFVELRQQALTRAGAKPIDDVAIHLRCGDILRTPSTGYGFLPFSAYLTMVPRWATSVGIVTHTTQNMGEEVGYWKANKDDGTVHTTAACSVLVHSLKEYLDQKFPKKRVTVHGRESEEQSMARISSAKVAICGASTFCIWPALVANMTYMSTQFWAPDSFKENVHKIQVTKTFPDGKSFLSTWAIASNRSLSKAHPEWPCATTITTSGVKCLVGGVYMKNILRELHEM